MIDSVKITIVTVVYNGVESIESTIISVINQTYKNIEYIIIDGGSTDGTQEIIKKYNDKITYWMSEPDKGIYDAMNKGAEKATGTWVNFMNSGDSFLNNESLNDVFKNDNSHFDVIYGSVKCFNKYESLVIHPKRLAEIKNHMIFCHQSSFVRTELIKKYKFNLKYKIAADYNLFYSLYKDNYLFKELPNCISIFEADNGISSNNFYLLNKEFLLINKKWSKFYSRLLFYNKMVFLNLSTFLKKKLPLSIVKKIKVNLRRIS